MATLRLAPGLEMRRNENGDMEVFVAQEEQPLSPDTIPEGFSLVDSSAEKADSGLPEGFFPVEPNIQEEKDLGDRNIFERLARQGGLALRTGIEGAAALPAMIANAPAAAINATMGTNFPDQNKAVSDALTKLGLPVPENRAESLVNAIGSGIGGAGAVVQGGKALAKISPNIGAALSAEPGVQAAAGAGAGGLAEIAKQAGFGDVGQFVAALMGGGAAGGVASAFRKAPVNPAASTLFEDIRQSGIDQVDAFGRLRDMLGNEAYKMQQQISGTFVGGKKVKPGLFDMAIERGDKVFIDDKIVNSLIKDLEVKADKDIDEDARGLYKAAATQLGTLLNKSPQSGKVSSITSSNASLNELESLRRSASKLSNNEGTKGYVGKDIKGSIDTLLDEALETKRVRGDESAIKLWQQAIRKRREFGDKFERPTEIAKAIERNPARKGELLRPDEEVMQAFIGGASPANKRNLSRIYDDTIAALPKEQKEKGQRLLKQSVVNQIVQRAGARLDEPDTVSATFLANEIRALRTGNKSMWDKFDNIEKKDLNRLEASLRKKGGSQLMPQLLKRFLRRFNLDTELTRVILPKTRVDVEEIVNTNRYLPKSSALPAITLGSQVGNQ